MTDWFDVALRWAPPVLYGFSAGLMWSSTRRAWRRAEAALEQTRVALDALEQMEEAHDPGREVHERLARAVEATLIRQPASGDKPDPAGRRAMAMVVATQWIETIGRANLILTTKDEDAE